MNNCIKCRCRRIRRKQPMMSDEDLRSLKAILDYLWEQEERDYYANFHTLNHAEHIFRHLEALDGWVQRAEERRTSAE